MTIQSILEKYDIEPQYGEIQLGTINGWGERQNSLWDELKPYRVENSGTERSLGRCYTEYSFTIRDEQSEYNVVYSVDSSD